VMPEMLGAALEGKPVVVHGDGRQSRSFMHVSDLVDAFVRLVNDPHLDGAILNVGNPDEITVCELAETIIRLTGSTSPIVHGPAREGDPQRRRPDIARVMSRYGWEPHVGLDDGLSDTIRFLTGAAAAADGRGPAGAPSSASHDPVADFARRS
jgi:UDP-glucuronate decarboxylase